MLSQSTRNQNRWSLSFRHRMIRSEVSDRSDHVLEQVHYLALKEWLHIEAAL